MEDRNSNAMTPSMMSYCGEVTHQCPRIRLSVLGAKGVGKTAIIVRYLTRRFIGEYRSQIDITYRNMIKINDKETNIEIIDFSSKTGEDRIPDIESTVADCYLVVYSISDRVSFLKAVNIVCVLRAMSSSSSAPVTLLGNKKDLDHSRQVSQEELQNIATLFMCEPSEVSAAETTEDIIPVMAQLFTKTYELVSQRERDTSEKIKTFSECNSEPSLLKNKLCAGTSQSRKRERSLETTSEQFHCSFSCSSNANNSDESDRCSTCSQRHERASSYSKASNSPRSVRKRKALKSPHARSYSLNYKDHRGKSDPKFLINKTSRGASTLSTSDGINEHCKLTKKDSKISDFLNCGKVTDNDSDNVNYYSQRSLKSECNTTSISSFWLRGRSFTTENLKAERKKFSSFRSINSTTFVKTPPTPCGTSTLAVSLGRSRKSLSRKFLCTDPSVSISSNVTEVKPKTISYNAMKPPIKRTSKISPESHSPTAASVRTSVEDRISNFLKKKSTTITESPTFMSLIGKMSEPAINSALPPFISSPEKRERKFAVFGINALTNVFSKTSLPDLPKATANLYTKFGSFKNTIKKRSV